MRYKGSVGVFWRVIAAAVAVACVGTIAHAALSGADALTVALCAAPAAIATALMAWITLDNYVELAADTLRVCVGPFRLQVPYGDVVRVSGYRPEGAVVALALGRERVAIGRRGRASVVVSPEDAGGFMDELRRRVGCQ